MSCLHMTGKHSPVQLTEALVTFKHSTPISPSTHPNKENLGSLQPIKPDTTSPCKQQEKEKRHDEFPACYFLWFLWFHSVTVIILYWQENEACTFAI